MAKSLKSRRQRKMRAVKRERYGKLADSRLKKALEHGAKQLLEDAQMQDMVEVKEGKSATSAAVDEAMDTGATKTYNAKTKRDENGHYPVWMSKKEKRKLQTKSRKSKKGVKRGQGGKKGQKSYHNK